MYNAIFDATKTYDLVLVEKPLCSALSIDEIISITKCLKSSENGYIPVEFEGLSSTAMGFISYDMADALYFDYNTSNQDCINLNEFVKEILADVEKETFNSEYTYNIGSETFSIYLTR